MILFFAGAGTTKVIRPEDAIVGQKRTGTLLAYWDLHFHKKSEPAKRFQAIRKKRNVRHVR